MTTLMQARLSSRGFVHYVKEHRQPLTSVLDFDRPIKSDEPPYVRPGMKVSNQWTPIDFAYLTDDGVGLLRLQALYPELQVIPSEEERAEIQAGVIEVGVAVSDSIIRFALIRPGEASFCIEPCPGLRYHVRCQKGQGKLTIFAYPK